MPCFTVSSCACFLSSKYPIQSLTECNIQWRSDLDEFFLSLSLSGDLQPTYGDSRKSHTLRVGRYAQHFVDALQMDETPVEYLLRR